MNQKANEKILIKSLFLKIRCPVTSGIMVIIPIKRRNSSESRDKEKRKRRLPKEIPAIFLISSSSSICLTPTASDMFWIARDCRRQHPWHGSTLLCKSRTAPGSLHFHAVQSGRRRFCRCSRFQRRISDSLVCKSRKFRHLRSCHMGVVQFACGIVLICLYRIQRGFHGVPYFLWSRRSAFGGDATGNNHPK